MPLDLSKLQNVKSGPSGRKIAACPCCRTDYAADHSGDHLVIFPDGRFGCLMYPQDKAHNRRIWQLAGDGTMGSGEEGDVQIEVYEDPKVEMPRTWPVELLERLIPDHSYWINRGVSEEVLLPLKGGVATSAAMRGRYVMPIFDTNNQIVGFTGRAIDPKNAFRWKHMGEKKSWVWGDLKGVREGGTAILVEGVGCRLALDTNGVRGAIVLWGTNLSESVLAFLISSRVQKIIIATNNDVKHNVGQDAARKIEAKLLKFFSPETVQIYLPLAKDFGEMDELQWTEWKKGLNQ